MGLRINTNETSLAAQRALSKTSTEQGRTMGRLSSGSRIVSAADDAAGLAISEKMKAHIKGVNQATRNASDGISMIQVAEGGLTEVSNILGRLRELSMQAASDNVGDAERALTNLEYQNLKEEIERIAQVTDFNGKKLLNGSDTSYEFQVGVNNNPREDRITFETENLNASLPNLGIENISVDTKEAAQDTLDILTGAIQKVSGLRSELGAKQNRLSSTVESLKINSENLSTANSRIRDADYASETASNAKLNILSQAGTSVLAQSNASGMNAIKLLS